LRLLSVDAMAAPSLWQLEDAVIARLRSCATFGDLLRAHGLAVRLCLSQSSYVATQIVHICNGHGRAAHAAGFSPWSPPRTSTSTTP